MKALPETHEQGLITFEQDIKTGGIKGDFRIQIAKDGRVWICVDGQALIRFKPVHLFKDYRTNKKEGKLK